MQLRKATDTLRLDLHCIISLLTSHAPRAHYDRLQLVVSTGTALSLALAGYLAHQGNFDPSSSHAKAQTPSTGRIPSLALAAPCVRCSDSRPLFILLHSARVVLGPEYGRSLPRRRRLVRPHTPCPHTPCPPHSALLPHTVHCCPSIRTLSRVLRAALHCACSTFALSSAYHTSHLTSHLRFGCNGFPCIRKGQPGTGKVHVMGADHQIGSCGE